MSHLDAEVLAHLADRGREAAGSTIGDGVVELGVAGPLDDLDQALLGDGIADLDRRADVIDRGRVHACRRERGAVNAVAADSTTEADDAVTDLRFGRDASRGAGCRAHRSTRAGSPT